MGFCFSCFLFFFSLHLNDKSALNDEKDLLYIVFVLVVSGFLLCTGAGIVSEG